MGKRNYPWYHRPLVRSQRSKGWQEASNVIHREGEYNAGCQPHRCPIKLGTVGRGQGSDWLGGPCSWRRGVYAPRTVLVAQGRLRPEDRRPLFGARLPPFQVLCHPWPDLDYPGCIWTYGFTEYLRLKNQVTNDEDLAAARLFLFLKTSRQRWLSVILHRAKSWIRFRRGS